MDSNCIRRRTTNFDGDIPSINGNRIRRINNNARLFYPFECWICIFNVTKENDWLTGSMHCSMSNLSSWISIKSENSSELTSCETDFDDQTNFEEKQRSKQEERRSFLSRSLFLFLLGRGDKWQWPLKRNFSRENQRRGMCSDSRRITIVQRHRRIMPWTSVRYLNFSPIDSLHYFSGSLLPFNNKLSL